MSHIHLFAYGSTMERGPYTARLHGELRMRTRGEPAARFGRHQPGYVYGQVQRWAVRELDPVVWQHMPAYALRQVASYKGLDIYALVDVSPDWANLPLVPGGMWHAGNHTLQRAIDTVPELIQKAKKRGPGHKPPGKTKVVVTEQRLNAMRDQMAKPIKLSLKKGLQAMRENVSADAMRKAFMRGKYEHLMDQVGDVVTEAVGKGIKRAVKGVHDEVLPQLPQNAQANLRYNHSNPRIQAHIENVTGNLITTSEQGMMSAVKGMTARAMTKGMNQRESAALIRGSIGLNGPQAETLLAYGAALRSEGVTGKTLEDALNARSDKMLDYRAELIARTEVRNAQNAGQLDIWRQGVNDDLLPKGSRKVWQVDGNPCEDWCGPMDGISVPLEETFKVSNVRTGQIVEVDYPSLIHPNCMCIMQIEMDEDAAAQRSSSSDWSIGDLPFDPNA